MNSAMRNPFDIGGSEHKLKGSEHWTNSPEYEELLAIAAKARKHERLPPEETELIIHELCQGRWLTRNQLAELMNRNTDGLRARFLTSMVAHQRLHLRYPDKPNRADQAYSANVPKENYPIFSIQEADE